MVAYAALAIVFYNKDGWFQFICVCESDDINITSTISQQQFYHNLKKKHNSRDKVVKYLYLDVISVATVKC